MVSLALFVALRWPCDNWSRGFLQPWLRFRQKFCSFAGPQVMVVSERSFDLPLAFSCSGRWCHSSRWCSLACRVGAGRCSRWKTGRVFCVPWTRRCDLPPTQAEKHGANTPSQCLAAQRGADLPCSLPEPRHQIFSNVWVPKCIDPWRRRPAAYGPPTTRPHWTACKSFLQSRRRTLQMQADAQGRRKGSRVTEDGAEVGEGRRHARVVLPEAGLRDLERTAPFFFTAI